MANGWTPERRARQATLIHDWKPWERSTGPRTADGKARSAKNRLDPQREKLRGEIRALTEFVDEALGAHREMLQRML